MLSLLLARTPEWVEDAKNYAALIASLGGAMTGAWHYVVKPYLDRQEAERKEAIEKARVERKREIEEAITPLQQEMKRTGDKVILQGDALHGVNRRLDQLQTEQKSLHSDVRAHMDAEDKKDGR